VSSNRVHQNSKRAISGTGLVAVTVACIVALGGKTAWAADPCKPTDVIERVVVEVLYRNSPDSYRVLADFNGRRPAMTQVPDSGNITFSYDLWRSNAIPPAPFAELRFRPYWDGWNFSPRALAACQQENLGGTMRTVATFVFEAERVWRFSVSEKNRQKVSMTCSDSACGINSVTDFPSNPVSASQSAIDLTANLNDECAVTFTMSRASLPKTFTPSDFPLMKCRYAGRLADILDRLGLIKVQVPTIVVNEIR